MIVGREKEIKKLNDLYNSDSAELVALYGRKRVGKTFLIDEVFEGTIKERIGLILQIHLKSQLGRGLRLKMYAGIISNK